MKKLIALAALCTAFGSANADPIDSGEFEAKNAEAHCSGASGHGLWVNSYRSDCAKYFSLEADGASVIVTLDSGVGGTIIGTAVNSLGEVATINLSFDGFLDDLDGSGIGYKQEGGLPYNDTTKEFMDFFTNVEGTISIEGEVFSISIHAYSLQLGVGANAKNDKFGLSTWIDATNAAGHTLRHWDLNFNLHRVPEPASLALLGLGLLGVGAARRRRTS